MSEGLQKTVRKYVLDYFLENEHAPVIEEVMEEFNLRRKEAFRVLAELEGARRLALLPGTQRILMAHPFSAITTPFKVTVGPKKYYANCAWDSVAFRAMLSKDVHIDSFCHHCAAPVTIDLRNEKSASDPPDPQIFLSMPAAKWWDDIVSTCSNNMVFFNSRQHLDEWLGEYPGLRGETLSVEKTVELGRMTYTDRMALDPERPPREELMKRFAAIGLTGDFWKL